jgi:hypothetical protein
MKSIVLMCAAAFAASSAPAFDAPTFNKDIAPILYRNCAGCHHTGEVAPFPLLSYQDAAKRAKLLVAVTASHYMPPWKPEPGYGHFQNERRLTDEQIALIAKWAANGAPEGDPADKPDPPVFTEGWRAGTPDKIFTLPSKYTLPADGADQFRCFVIPMNLDHDVYVKTFEFRPDNRRVVHHVILFTDPTGAGRKLAGGKDSYSCFGGPGFVPPAILGGWAPGIDPEVRAAGISVPVRAGSDLVLQIHYHLSGKVETDQSSLGLKFGEPPSVPLGLVLVNSRAIDIPPGDSHYVVKSSVTLPEDVTVLGITPHAHYLCKDMKVNARLPDGTVEPLIWIKDWDFNWQGQYRYTDPVKLPKGTRVEFEYTYDNSTANPRNPADPPVRVHWGEQTTDEMALVFLGVALAPGADQRAFQQEMALQYIDAFLEQGDSGMELPPEIPAAQRAQLTLLLSLFDKNHDGKLDAEERKALIDFLRSRMR